MFVLDAWSIAVIIIGAVVFIVITIIWGIRAHRHQIAAGKEDLIGKPAEVLIAMNPKGIVIIQGERWTATIEEGRAEVGEEVIITRVDGLKLWVTKK